MQSKLFYKIGSLILLSLVFSNPLLAQKKAHPKPLTPEEQQKLEKGLRRPPTGASFQISPIENVKGLYHALLAAPDHSHVEEFFQFDKLPILEAIVFEA